MPRKDPEEKKQYDREYQRNRRAANKQTTTTPSSGRGAPFCYVTKEGRTIPGNVLDQYAYKASEEESRQIKADRFMGAYKDAGLIQPLYNPETLAGITEINTYHARCCHVKARDTAGLGWDLKNEVDKPDETVKEQIEDLLYGQDLPLTTIFYRYQFDIEVIGHGGIEVVREGYEPQGQITILAHVPGHTLRIHRDENKFAQKRGNRTRWFKRINYEKDIHKDFGTEHELRSLNPDDRAAELIWSSLYTQRSDYYGVVDIIPALGAVHGDTARRDYNIAFFDNFGVPAYAVFITGDYDPGEIDPETNKTTLETTIEGHFKELAANPHATLVLAVPTIDGTTGGEVNIEFKPLAVDVKDASFRLYRKDNRDEVISAHGVPPYRLGIAETGSLGGSTATESTEIYKSSVINPRQEILEAMINQHIIWHDDGFAAPDWTFKFREIDTADEKHDIEMIKNMFDMGALRIRDVIRIFGQRFGVEDDPDDPLLDQRFVQGQPLTENMGDDQTQQIMKSLQEKITKVAMKYADGADSDFAGDRESFRFLESVKGANRVD